MFGDTPAHQQIPLRVIDAEDPVCKAATDGFFHAQEPEHQAGMVPELTDKGFGYGVVDVQDDFLPQKARNDGRENQERGE